MPCTPTAEVGTLPPLAACVCPARSSPSHPPQRCPRPKKLLASPLQDDRHTHILSLSHRGDLRHRGTRLRARDAGKAAPPPGRQADSCCQWCCLLTTQVLAGAVYDCCLGAPPWQCRPPTSPAFGGRRRPRRPQQRQQAGRHPAGSDARAGHMASGRGSAKSTAWHRAGNLMFLDCHLGRASTCVPAGALLRRETRSQSIGLNGAGQRHSPPWRA